MELFGTAGIRGSAEEDVDPELAVAIGRAAALEAGGETFALGHDGRITSPGLAAAVEAGLESGGAAVERVGQVPTSALAYASLGRRGIVVTASHNPPEDNGIKLFEDGVEYDGASEQRVEELIDEEPAPVEWSRWGSGIDGQVLDRYRAAVVEYVAGRFDASRPLEGLRVVVDCGNGVGGAATPQVLRSLGASPVALDANVDGHFPARGSKPTAESLSTLRQFAAADSAALGLAHDGDADRIAVVGPDGEVIHEDTILAVVAEHCVRASDADDPVVVTTPNASSRIDDRVSAAGGRTERTALGALHEGIARQRDRDGTVVFAAEPWKHVHPAFGGWIDGVVSAAVVAALVVRAGGTASLRERVDERPYRKENVRCPDDAKTDAMDRIERTLPDRFADGEVETEYGVRVDLPDGSWLLVRPSGTEPYVRVYAESEDVDAILEEARAAIESAVEEAT